LALAALLFGGKLKMQEREKYGKNPNNAKEPFNRQKA
jgi:hypothetical protein